MLSAIADNKQIISRDLHKRIKSTKISIEASFGNSLHEVTLGGVMDLAVWIQIKTTELLRRRRRYRGDMNHSIRFQKVLRVIWQ